MKTESVTTQCIKDAENVYAPLVMVSIWGRKRTLADKTVCQNRSIYTSFDPPLFSLDRRTYKRRYSRHQPLQTQFARITA
jgi:hypothetical protein